jgi:hypothetical protein
MSATRAAFLQSGRWGAGDGCTASHSQPRLLLMAELAPISDAGAGDPGICNGPQAGITGLFGGPQISVGFQPELPAGRAEVL